MKKAMLWFLLAMLLLTLTACGEAKKYEEAQALMKGGAYSEAYEAFAELGRYEDAKQLAEDAKWALYAQAQEDLRLGRYQEAMDAVEPFLHNVNMKALYQYAEAGLAGTYVRDLIWHEGSISCDVAIAQGLPGAEVRIELESKGGALQGKVYATARSVDQENPQAHFSIADYASGEGYRLDAVNLNSFRYTIPAKKTSFYDNGIFTPGTLLLFKTATLFQQTIAQDGSKGYTPSWDVGFVEFNSIQDTFAGGTMSVNIRSQDKVVFALSVDIPDAK